MRLWTSSWYCGRQTIRLRCPRKTQRHTAKKKIAKKLTQDRLVNISSRTPKQKGVTVSRTWYRFYEDYSRWRLPVSFFNCLDLELQPFVAVATRTTECWIDPIMRQRNCGTTGNSSKVRLSSKILTSLKIQAGICVTMVPVACIETEPSQILCVWLTK